MKSFGSVNPQKRYNKRDKHGPRVDLLGEFSDCLLAGLLKHEHKTNRAAQGTLVVSMFFLSCVFPIWRKFYLVDSYFYK